MTVTTATIDRTVDDWRMSFIANDNLGLIGIAKEEVWRIVIAWRKSNILGCNASAAAIDLTGRIAVVGAVCSTHSTASDGDTGLTATEESLTKLTLTVPEVARKRLAVAGGIVVICAAGIVALTDRAIIATTHDIAHDVTTGHDNSGVAIYLSCCPTWQVNISRIQFMSGAVSQFTLIGTNTLTAAIDAEAYQTLFDLHFSVSIDVTIFGTAIDTGTDTCRITIVRRRCRSIVDGYIGLTHIGTECLGITLHSFALAATEDVALNMVDTRLANATASDGHSCLTANSI